MKRLVPIPPESVERIKKEKKEEWSYQFVSVTLKDGRRFDPAIASEGYIIEVKGHMNIPFEAEDVQSVAVTHKHWNFRREKLDRFAEYASDRVESSPYGPGTPRAINRNRHSHAADLKKTRLECVRAARSACDALAAGRPLL